MAYDNGGVNALKPKPSGGRIRENMTLKEEKNLQSHRAIDPHTSDADAQSRADMGAIAAALITMGVRAGSVLASICSARRVPRLFGFEALARDQRRREKGSGIRMRPLS
jgi:hypothetical protein